MVLGAVMLKLFLGLQLYNKQLYFTTQQAQLYNKQLYFTTQRDQRDIMPCEDHTAQMEEIGVIPVVTTKFIFKT